MMKSKFHGPARIQNDLPAGSPDLAPPANLRWNFTWAALSGALFETGASFADTGTIVAVFIGRLTPSALAVGAAESIRRYGWLVPQLFAANYAQGLRYRKRIYLIGGWGRAFFLLLLAGALVLISDESGLYPNQLLFLFFVLWTGFSFVSGLAGVPYNDIVGRVIPAGHRSRLLAVRFFAGGTLAVGAGILIRFLLQGNGSLRPYGIIFAIGAVTLALSTACFALIREAPAPGDHLRPRFAEFVRAGLRVLRTDRRLRFFLYVQLLSAVTSMATPFYVVQARRSSSLVEAEVGTLLAAHMLGAVLLNPVWGWWGDRHGELSLQQALAAISLLSPALALGLPRMTGLSSAATLAGYSGLFFVLGAVQTGNSIATLAYLMHISPDDRRPEYSGYNNALVAPTRLLPLLAGALAQTFSLSSVFAVAALAVPFQWIVLERLGRIPAGGSS